MCSALTSAGEEEEIDLLSVLEGASKPERVVKVEPREARTACGMVARVQDPGFVRRPIQLGCRR